MTSILGEVTGEFERTTGHKLSIQYGSTTRIKSRIEADEAADLTINENFVLDDLLHQARIANGTIVGIARSPLAIGVRAGAPKPDVSSVDALKRTLLAAEKHRLSRSQRRPGRDLFRQPHELPRHRR